jgi:DNA-binding transcriptional ArsR family regulator
MSVGAVQWALETSVGDATAKLVLLALADEADSDGLCWPFHKRLATRAEVSEKTVSRKITYLEDAGLLKKGPRKRRRSGRLSGYDYSLAMAPPDTLSAGSNADDEDRLSGPDAGAPSSQSQDDPAGATGDHGDASSTPAPDRQGRDTPASDQTPTSPPDTLSGGPADTLSCGPGDTAVSGGPADTQVSAGKEDPPRTDPPPPPTPSAGGGGGSDDADSISPDLAVIVDRLDDLARRRLTAEPRRRLRRLSMDVQAAIVDGWPIGALADVVTDGPLTGTTSPAAVLASRIQRHREAGPPRRRPTAPAARIPPDVLADLEARAAADAMDDAGAVDPQLRSRRLAELTTAWLADHPQEATG